MKDKVISIFKANRIIKKDEIVAEMILMNGNEIPPVAQFKEGIVRQEQPEDESTDKELDYVLDKFKEGFYDEKRTKKEILEIFND
jgi:hypothetical protein